MKKNKLILITGASSGIGWATARAFAALGSNLILIARRRERLEALKRDVESEFGIQAHTLQCDISKYAAVEALFNGPAAPLLQMTDVLVNNAGLALGWTKFYKSRSQDWNQVIDTNVKGLLYLIRHTVPFMHKRNFGHVINIGSVAGRWIYPNDAVYCASKFAVRAINESLRMDLFGTNVRVTTISPGPVKTEIAEIRMGSKARAADAFAGFDPLLPEDIADAITWVVEQPEHVNVQEIVMFPTAQASIFQLEKKSKPSHDIV